MKALEVLDVIYDGQCAFCVRTLRVISALDCRGALRFHEAGDTAAGSARICGLRRVDLSDAMYVIEPGGAIHEGFFGFRCIVWSTPLMWPLLPLFYVPGMAILGPRAYAWIARHRRQFGCRTDAGVSPPGMRPGCPS